MKRLKKGLIIFFIFTFPFICSANELKWKFVDCWGLPAETKEDIKKLITYVKKLGFNVFGTQTKSGEKLELLLDECEKQGIEVYQIIELKSHSNLGQSILKEEKQALAKKLKNKDYDDQEGGEPVEKGDIFKDTLLCFNKEGSFDYVKEKLIKIANNKRIKGILFDYFGYQNYYACFCDACESKREEYAKNHPELKEKDLLYKFSEDSMVNFINAVVNELKKTRADIKTSCHVYPYFMPNPLYGNRLNLDYTGQTVSWFFLPHWSLEKVRDTTRIIVNDRCIPMIGICGGKHRKSPERIFSELKILKEANAEGVIISNLAEIVNDEEVAKVISRELGGTW